jgi:hypothetical protein
MGVVRVLVMRTFAVKPLFHCAVTMYSQRAKALPEQATPISASSQGRKTLAYFLCPAIAVAVAPYVFMLGSF